MLEDVALALCALIYGVKLCGVSELRCGLADFGLNVRNTLHSISL